MRDLAESWLGFAKIQWMVIHEARPEVTRRRDSGSSAQWLTGRKVLILGCGALGAPIAEHCVRAGVAQLHVVDKGAVTPGILVRQPYEDADIGYNKAERLAQRLSRIRGNLTVTSARGDIVTGTLADPAPLLGYDLIIDATADIGVRVGIERLRAAGREDWPPIISALFGHTAQRGIATVSMTGATGSGHDILRRLAIDTVTNPPPGGERSQKTCSRTRRARTGSSLNQAAQPPLSPAPQPRSRHWHPPCSPTPWPPWSTRRRLQCPRLAATWRRQHQLPDPCR
ncbi:HesA/MoeB/ThiF family protein [Curtobacterium sp. 24E2]|nr:ThiF family adenylyltransferase [Curtobacterium sp. 24E2]